MSINCLLRGQILKFTTKFMNAFSLPVRFQQSSNLIQQTNINCDHDDFVLRLSILIDVGAPIYGREIEYLSVIELFLSIFKCNTHVLILLVYKYVLKFVPF